MGRGRGLAGGDGGGSVDPGIITCLLRAKNGERGWFVRSSIQPVFV